MDTFIPKNWHWCDVAINTSDKLALPAICFAILYVLYEKFPIACDNEKRRLHALYAIPFNNYSMIKRRKSKDKKA